MSAAPPVDVGPVAEFPAGAARRVRVANRDVAVFHIDGAFYAVKDACPHQGDPLSRGRLDGCAVVCPGHDWVFDLRTGQCTGGGGLGARLSAFPVSVVAGRVRVTP